MIFPLQLKLIRNYFVDEISSYVNLICYILQVKLHKGGEIYLSSNAGSG